MESHIYRRPQKRNRSGSTSYHWKPQKKTASIPKFSSIFTAETHVIYSTMITISATKGNDFDIFADSRSCIQELQKQIPTNPKVRKLKPTLANLHKTGKTLELCWLPVHAGTPGNETADKKAKQAS